jgi:hypothetical protein
MIKKLLDKLFLKDLDPRDMPRSDAGPTIIDNSKMNLDERVEWRTQMVYNVVRETLIRFGVTDNKYRLKVVPFDGRAHMFYVNMDIGRDFALGQSADNVEGFAGIENVIATTTFKQYGISIAGMYWRADDSKNVFDIMRYSPNARRKNLEIEFEDTCPEEIFEDMRSIKRKDFEELNKDEIEAFRYAISVGMKPPTIHIGNKEYQSDLAPLDLMSIIKR